MNDLRNARQDQGKRTRRHFDFGDKCGVLLRNLIPLSYCAVATATCRFQILGSKAWPGRKVGDRPVSTEKEGRIFLTRMQTNGIQPSPYWKAASGNRAKWATSNSIEGANDVLAPFQLEMRDVISHFGNVTPTSTKELDLVEIVEALRPGLLQAASDVPHVVDTTALAGTLTDGLLA